MIEEIFDEDELKLTVRVHLQDIDSENSISDAFEHLDQAMSQIVKKLGDSEIYSFAIAIRADGFEPESGEFDPYDEGGATLSVEHPWTGFCPRFWTNALKYDKTRERVMKWTTRIENILKTIDRYGRSTESLWEDDETQFGEPLLTHLALSDVALVPSYTKVLKLWDLGHEVEQNGEIAAIVDKHGICPETEDLIYTRVILNPGQRGLDLLRVVFPLLQSVYGDATQSKLFRQMVVTEYAQQIIARGIDDVSFDNGLLKYGDDEAIVDGARQIYAELDAIAGANGGIASPSRGL